MPTPPPPLEVDVAVVGAGGAGLAVVLALDALVRARGVPAPRLALIDPVHRAGRDRTWCFWDTPDGEVTRAVAPAISRHWRFALVVAADGQVLDLDLDPMRYHLVTSSDYYREADAAARRLGAVRVTGSVEDVHPRTRDRPAHVVVAHPVTGRRVVIAGVVLDSRPVPPALPALTAWLQHFQGWAVPASPPGPTPTPRTEHCVLMDFRVIQPDRGLAFGYVLPGAMPGGRSLVEYTVFGPAAGRCTTPYAAAMEQYLALPDALADVLPAGEHLRAGDVLDSCGHLGGPDEDGEIPMTDAVPYADRGDGVHGLGVAAGAARASTGFAFATMQRQAAAVARALVEGEDPTPPPAYPARHRWMDSLLLRALDRGEVDGRDLFVRLFRAHPTERVLRFLDGRTGVAEDLALMSAAPILPMVRAGAADALARARRRTITRSPNR